ncbi:MAG TPA: hypothetical protein V6C76_08540 [Drouetiella sp.]
MSEAKSERTEKAPEKAQASSSLKVTNEDFAKNALSTPREQLPGVIENGQMKFSDLYGPKDSATALAAAAPVKDGSGTPVKDAAGNPVDAARNPRDGSGNPTDRSPTTDKPVNPADIKEQKERLENLTKGMSPDQAAEMHKDMAALENRKPPLSAEQVNKIYDSTSKLLEDPNHTSKLNQAERNQLAAGILHNASLRTGLDQGFHNTCNVSTLDRRLNVVNPAEAARIVSEAGLTGQFQRPDGSIVKLDAKSLHPDNEAAMRFDDKANDNKRNYASQVFDQVAVNDYWQKHNPPMFYSQGPRESQKDTGERLRYADGREVNGPDGKPMRSPGLTVDNIAQVGKDLGFSGQYILGNAEVAGQRDVDGATKIHSYKEFTDALSKSQPPTVIMVNANDKLFGGNGDKGGSGGWHVVTVNDYQAGPPPRVFMNNQWGSANNKWVNVSDLYNSTLPSNAGRVDDGGNLRGGGDNGDRPGPGGDNGGSGGGRGWSRNDGVMREEDQRRWLHDVVDPNAPKDKLQEQKDLEEQQRQLQLRKQDAVRHAMDQMASLQGRLRQALASNDAAAASQIEAELASLNSTA